MHLTQRIKTYQKVLQGLKDIHEADLLNRIHTAPILHQGIGGVSTKIYIDSTPVFVKRIPISDLEMENKYSTKNLFDLPMCYQYGIGSTGFSVWRELEMHTRTTQWSLQNICTNFPIMYYYIVSPKTLRTPTLEGQKNIEKLTQYWGNSKTIQKRLEASYASSHELIIFLEYIPNTLAQTVQTAPDSDLEKIINMAKRDINKTTCFMAENGIVHFDAHMHNILTDTEQLYFTDFGLASAQSFELSHDEESFRSKHTLYDAALALTSLVKQIQERPKPPRNIENIIAPYQKVSHIVDTFMKGLMANDNKTLTFPYKDVFNSLPKIHTT